MMDAPPLRRPTRTVVAVVLWLAVPAALAGDVFKWTDAEGHVHFGDKPPATGGAEQITVRGGHAAVDTDRRERTERLLQEFATERAEQAEQEAAAAREEAQRVAACNEARNRHFEYQNSGYLYEWDARGEKRVLSDAEHRRARAEARAEVDKWCE